jgi:hypothetical protein
LLGG